MTLPKDWQTAIDLAPHTSTPVDQLADLAYKGFGGGVVLPLSKDQVFRAFELTSFADVRAVIVGQDPFPDHKLANGVAFSVQQQTAPKALEAILSNLENSGPTIHFSRPKSSAGDVSVWAERGVLLLNASLTHEPDHLSGHCRLWKPLLRAVLQAVGRKSEPVPFLMLGGKAVDLKSAVKRIDARIISGHPTPRNNQSKRFRLFALDRPFLRANEFLIQNGSRPIDWSLE